MRVNLARKIDYFVGIPLCFLLCIIKNIKKCLFRKINIRMPPERIVFLGLSEIGSALLAYPAIKRVKQRYSGVEIYFWIFKENSDILFLFDFISKNNIFIMRSQNIFTLCIDALSAIRKMRKEKIDTIIDLELFSRFTSILSYLSGAKARVGFYKYKLEGLYRGNLHTHRVMYNPYSHISKNFISLTDALQSSLTDIPLVKEPVKRDSLYLPKISISNQERENMWNKLRAMSSLLNRESKIIIINLGSNDKIPIRKWPMEHYLELIHRILEKQDTFIVLIGVGSPNASPFFSQSERCINLTGKTTIKELIALFSIASVLISYDCGILHVASTTNIYIIALFGPETPLLYGPLTENKKIFYKNFSCSPCLSAYNHRNSICKNNKCMQAITVDKIYNEVIKEIK